MAEKVYLVGAEAARRRSDLPWRSSAGSSGISVHAFDWGKAACGF